MRIFDFSACPFSDRNGTYGGNSGDKEGIIINNKTWIIKYPKKGSKLKNGNDLLYSTTPESEYIGSHIYKILGYPVHKTILGIKNGHVVVACKDLCEEDTKLIEFRQLKNIYNKTLNEKLDLSMSSTGSEHFVLLDEVLIHLDYNPLLVKINGIKERFWDCVIIDGFINNNDRNNGNWGVLRNKKGDTLAPIFDNGASFSPNVSEQRIRNKLNNTEALSQGILDSITAYSLDGTSNAKFTDIIKTSNKDLQKAVKRTVPLIQNRLTEINEMIDDIPEKAGDYVIISEARKKLYKKELQIRLEKILIPEYKHIVQTEKIEKLHPITKDDDFGYSR